MRKIVYFITCLCILQSCYTKSSCIDDLFVKQQISIYKRIGDDYRVRNVLRMFIILRKSHSSYELYTEAGSGIVGKYFLKNDTLTLLHEYEFVVSDSSLKISKFNEKDTVPEFYPRKFIVRKDSLIDITNYKSYHEYPEVSARKRENYILVK